MFASKIMLITGGTGSFGNAMVCRFLSTDIREVRVLSRDETNHGDVRNRYANPKLRFCIGNVRDPSSVRQSTDKAVYPINIMGLSKARWKR